MSIATEKQILRIGHMLEQIDGLRDMLHGKSAADVQDNWLMSRALERAFEIISEASRHLSDDVKAREPDIPWKRIAGIGNVLRHDYDGLELRLLFTTAQNDLPALEAALKRQLALLQGSDT